MPALTWFGMGYKPLVGADRPELSGARRRTCCSAPARRCSCAARCSTRSAVSTSATSCSTRTSTSAGGSTCAAGGSLRAGLARLPPASRARCRTFGSYKEELPARAQRALHALQEPRADAARRGARPPRWPSRCAERSPRRASTRRRSTSGAGATTTVLDDAVPKSRSPSVYAIDQFVEQLPASTEARTRRAAHADRDATGLSGHCSARDATAFRSATPTYARRYETSSTAFAVHRTSPTHDARCWSSPATRSVRASPARPSGPWQSPTALAARARRQARHARPASSRSTRRSRSRHVAAGDDRAFAPIEAWADVIVFQGHAMGAFESSARARRSSSSTSTTRCTSSSWSRGASCR